MHRFHGCTPSRMHYARIRLRSHHVATFWVSDRRRPFLRLGSGSRFPRDPTGALRARRHSCSDPGELDHLPAGHYSLGRPSPLRRGTSGRAWERPGGDPGPFDRCLLLTDVVFKDDRLTSRRTSHRHVPTRCESLRFHAAMLASVSRRIAPGCCLPQPPIRRRTSDAPSPAGFPSRAMSTVVGPRSLARSQVETRKPRPTPPSRVNGFLGLALARSTFSLCSLSA